jgi:hypothetical protein
MIARVKETVGLTGLGQYVYDTKLDLNPEGDS